MFMCGGPPAHSKMRYAADTLAQSVPHNVTSEMGMALLDVADVVRPHPEVVLFLQNLEGDGFLDELPKTSAGKIAKPVLRRMADED